MDAPQTPESVALSLVHLVAAIEGKSLNRHSGEPGDRQWLLDTYAECLQAAKSNRSWQKK